MNSSEICMPVQEYIQHTTRKPESQITGLLQATSTMSSVSFHIWPFQLFVGYKVADRTLDALEKYIYVCQHSDPIGEQAEKKVKDSVRHIIGLLEEVISLMQNEHAPFWRKGELISRFEKAQEQLLDLWDDYYLIGNPEEVRLLNEAKKRASEGKTFSESEFLKGLDVSA